MDSSQQTFSNLISFLDYQTSPNFISSDSPIDQVPEELRFIWRETKNKLSIDAVYFIANAPVIYFKQFESFNSENVAELHRSIWNQCQAPLIFVVMPNDIRIYCGYEAPSRVNKKKELKEPTRLDKKVASNPKTASNQLYDSLQEFSRTAIESGSFWLKYNKYFRKETRVDKTLIANLCYVRQELIKIGKLKPEHAHSLIGRSIFALYLQDRGVLPTGKNSFFAEKYKNDHYIHYTDILSSYEDTYDFFDFLHKRFNGDMFPVTAEEKQVITQDHLNTLRRLFTIDEQAGGQMLFFWAYNFKFIPIELISRIYEEFLHEEEKGKNGTHYTPPMLVDFMLNQVMPWTETNYKLRLLDPACGSGIFLVEAYHRHVERWLVQHGPKISFKILSEILTTSIFGVDIKGQALRIAAFSLYLAMLDYLEPKSIWLDVHFPQLLETNLIEADFFEESVTFDNSQFDLVIGNPPWESKLTAPARDFLLKRNFMVGDNQVLQAFLRRTPDFCVPNGQIALLCSSKSLLFNKSLPNVSFRKDLFTQFNVKAIFDFSALRRHLFEKGLGPAAAIFYTPQKPRARAKIFYGAPKPTLFSRLLSAIVIEASDLKQLPLRQVLDSTESMAKAASRSHSRFKQHVLFTDDQKEEAHTTNIWKIALWGTNYDYTLIENLNNYPSLAEVIQLRGWHTHVGFNKNGPRKGKCYQYLDNALYLSADYLTRYGIDAQALPKLPEGELYYRGGSEAAFKAPFVAFKRGQSKRRPCATFLSIDCAYTEAITGIAGPGSDTRLLKVLTALLNSEIAQYYLFLTSASWGVEREEIKAGEVRNLPFPFLDVKEDIINKIALVVDGLIELSTQASRVERGDEILPLPSYLNKKSAADRKEEPTHSKKISPDENISVDYKVQQPVLFIDDINLANIQNNIERLEKTLNDLIYTCFGLSEREIRLIRETIECNIGFFNNPDDSLAQKSPDNTILMNYAQTYIEAINFYLEPIGRKMVAAIYNMVSHSFITIQFFSTPLEREVPSIEIKTEKNLGNDLLSLLDKLNQEPISGRIFHRRNFRVYDKVKDTLSFLKPAEQWQWTTASALRDADETILEIAN